MAAIGALAADTAYYRSVEKAPLETVDICTAIFNGGSLSFLGQSALHGDKLPAGFTEAER